MEDNQPSESNLKAILIVMGAVQAATLVFAVSAWHLSSVAAKRAAISMGGVPETMLEPVVRLETPLGTGSGFMVSDDLVVSNHHVTGEVGNVVHLSVKVPNAQEGYMQFGGLVVATDAKNDLALVRVFGVKFNSWVPLSTHRPTEGSRMTEIGCPNANLPMVTQGTYARMYYDRESDVYRYSISITSYLGNSGGPIFDTETGEVVGVAVGIENPRLPQMPMPLHLTVAIPSTTVLEFLSDYKVKTERAARP